MLTTRELTMIKEWIVVGVDTLEEYRYLSKVTDGVSITEDTVSIVQAGGYSVNGLSAYAGRQATKEVTCQTSSSRQEIILMLKYPNSYVISISDQEYT